MPFTLSHGLKQLSLQFFKQSVPNDPSGQATKRKWINTLLPSFGLYQIVVYEHETIKHKMFCNGTNLLTLY
jgi:hypothetical protein